MINPDNIAIVLKGVYYEGNIGSTARAMMNMGLSNLILVAPNCKIGQEAHSNARNASVILENTRIFNTLDELSPHFEIVLGTSRRGFDRLHLWTTPRIMAKELSGKYRHVKTAIVFGDEKAGLTNEDLSHCAWYVTIPSHPDFESLNVSQAVMVVCYELYLSMIEEQEEVSKDKADPENIRSLNEHIAQFFRKIKFPPWGSEQRTLADVSRIIASADLNRTDVNLAHGFLRFIEARHLGGKLPRDFNTTE
jgi:TrmH family RNA methyltransferase